MRSPSHSPRRTLTVVEKMSAKPTDFSDVESQRVLNAAAAAVAFELGREAGREYFAELIGKKAPK